MTSLAQGVLLLLGLVASVVLALLIASPVLVAGHARERVLQVRCVLVRGIADGTLPAADPLVVQLLAWCQGVGNGRLYRPPAFPDAGVPQRLYRHDHRTAALVEELIRECRDTCDILDRESERGDVLPSFLRRLTRSYLGPVRVDSEPPPPEVVLLPLPVVALMRLPRNPHLDPPGPDTSGRAKTALRVVKLPQHAATHGTRP